MEIYKKLEDFYEPLWSIEILLCIFVGSTWFIGCVTEYSLLSIVCFSLTQIVIGWMGHSAVHNRNIKLNKFGRYEAALFGGFSL
jgi:hypothetical protein